MDPPAEPTPVGFLLRQVTKWFASKPIHLSFPASDIQGLACDENGQPMMTINFMGLLGSHGVLPNCYTEFVLSRMAARDKTLLDFLDIFHHRLISLFYQAWRKYRVLERPGDEISALPGILLNVIGLGTEGLRSRQAIPDEDLFYYAGLFAQQPRSASTLRNILMDYFDVPVEIQQFVGEWYSLDASFQCSLDAEEDNGRQLGLGAVVGDQIWECRIKARIVLGPLSRKQYMDFLPSGAAFRRLQSIVRFFSDEIDFEAQLVLQSDNTPGCVLGGGSGERAPLLGWLSWLKTRDMNRNPADTLIPL
jgi:type VI secretion system protein ImpH